MSTLKARPEVPVDQIRNPSDRAAIEEGCYFDQEAGDYVCTFFESFLHLSKGVDEPFPLLPWQRDVLTRLYGWKRADGSRRFREGYIGIPKKNGKSTLCSGLALYHLIADGEHGAEVYCAASDLEQARVVFNEAMNMVDASPQLKRILDVVKSAKRIFFEGTRSVLRALSADSGTKEGLNASACFIDELHAHKTPDLFNVLRYAGAARRQPLLLIITTAGYDRQSICFRQYDHAKKVQSGAIIDTGFFTTIFEADENDDFDDPATWAKANPSLGSALTLDNFKDDYNRAKAEPLGFNTWLRYRLNIWTNASERILRRDRWDECGALITLAPSARETCFGGLDLASTTDLAAYTLFFPPEDDDGIARTITRFFAPEEGAIERQRKDRVPYLAWAKQGFLTLTPGDVIDYQFIRRALLADAERYSLIKLGIDPWNATQLATQLAEEDGLEVEMIRQGFLSLNAPTQELVRLVTSRRLAHGNNPVLNWNADNAVGTEDAAGNIKLDKGKSTERIDGLASHVNAIAIWINSGADTGPSVYETRGVLSF